MVSVPVAWRVRHRRSFHVPAVVSTLAAFAARLVAPHRPALANLASMPLTAAGFGLVDFAAFHIAHGWGWLVTGLSLVLLEHLIADES